MSNVIVTIEEILSKTTIGSFVSLVSLKFGKTNGRKPIELTWDIVTIWNCYGTLFCNTLNAETFRNDKA